eukprot:COSAG05_NODE_331_length_11273_cov_3.896635_10_plen_85_part_00
MGIRATPTGDGAQPKSSVGHLLRSLSASCVSSLSSFSLSLSLSLSLSHQVGAADLLFLSLQLVLHMPRRPCSLILGIGEETLVS